MNEQNLGVQLISEGEDEISENSIEIFSSELKIVGKPIHLIRNFFLGLVFNFITLFYVLILKGFQIFLFSCNCLSIFEFN